MAPKLIANIQTLRFFAAALVVAAHSVDFANVYDEKPQWLVRSLENFGAVGVDLFFVISGFIITLVGFGGGWRDWREFGASRFLRVAPLYYLLSAPWLVMAFLGDRLFFQNLVATFAFFPAAGNEVVFPYLALGWTLCFEVLFYGCVALVLATRRIETGLALIAAYFFMSIYGLAWQPSNASFQFFGNPIIWEFLFGVIVALSYAKVPKKLGLASIVLGIALLGASILVDYGDISQASPTINASVSLQRALWWGIPCALIVLGAVVTSDWENWGGAAARSSVWLGGASYSLYLVHQLVLNLSNRLFRLTEVDLSYAGAFTFAFATSMVSGVLVFLLLERPLIKGIAHLRASGWRPIRT